MGHFQFSSNPIFLFTDPFGTTSVLLILRNSGQAISNQLQALGMFITSENKHLTKKRGYINRKLYASKLQEGLKKKRYKDRRF